MSEGDTFTADMMPSVLLVANMKHVEEDLRVTLSSPRYPSQRISKNLLLSTQWKRSQLPFTLHNNTTQQRESGQVNESQRLRTVSPLGYRVSRILENVLKTSVWNYPAVQKWGKVVLKFEA